MPSTFEWLKFAHVLRTIKVLDDRFANPAYALLLVTGLLMVWQADLPLSTTSYRRLAARGRVVGVLLGVLVVAIVFLMVTKPTP